MDETKVKKFIVTALSQGFGVSEIQNYLLTNLKQAGSNPIGNALKILSKAGPITQQFGNFNPTLEKYSGGVNYGTDIGVGEGTGVNLPEGVWKILEAVGQGGMNRGYGNSVLAQNTKTGEKLRFSHLSKVIAAANQILQGGSQIGATGATGNVTGPHLDLEYYDPQGQVKDVLKSVYGKAVM